MYHQFLSWAFRDISWYLDPTEITRIVKSLYKMNQTKKTVTNYVQRHFNEDPTKYLKTSQEWHLYHLNSMISKIVHAIDGTEQEKRDATIFAKSLELWTDIHRIASAEMYNYRKEFNTYPDYREMRLFNRLFPILDKICEAWCSCIIAPGHDHHHQSDIPDHRRYISWLEDIGALEKTNGIYYKVDFMASK